MENNSKYLSDLHFEHLLWLSKLNFYKDEVRIYEARLASLTEKYTNEEVLAQVEQFQNKFITQKQIMDILKHKVKLHEEALTKYVLENPVAIDHVKFRDHGELREQTGTFEMMFEELKENFQRFSSKWM